MEESTFAIAALNGLANALGVWVVTGLGAFAAFLLGLLFLKLFGLVD